LAWSSAVKIDGKLCWGKTYNLLKKCLYDQVKPIEVENLFCEGDTARRQNKEIAVCPQNITERYRIHTKDQVSQVKDTIEDYKQQQSSQTVLSIGVLKTGKTTNSTNFKIF
jgi:hypothetical protein